MEPSPEPPGPIEEIKEFLGQLDRVITGKLIVGNGAFSDDEPPPHNETHTETHAQKNAKNAKKEK